MLAFKLSFTIRNLDSKLSTELDTDQHKVINIQEDPLDNRQKYLDVMCFPGLFPNGNFGEFHPHEKKISHSEYIKSRLLNKDSRFRKNAQYALAKRNAELSAGVYNLLKSMRSQPMSVSMFLNQVETSDNGLMLQSVRGTKQYWFVRQSELSRMIHELLCSLH